jgi:hypothetical protein
MNGAIGLERNDPRHCPLAAWRARKKLDALTLPDHTTGWPGDEQEHEKRGRLGSGVALGTGDGVWVGATTGAAACAATLRCIATTAANATAIIVLAFASDFPPTPITILPSDSSHRRCDAAGGLVQLAII